MVLGTGIASYCTGAFLPPTTPNPSLKRRGDLDGEATVEGRRKNEQKASYLSDSGDIVCNGL